MNKSDHTLSAQSEPEIADVLQQNVEVAEQIKVAANELEVVHAVLSTQLPPAAATGDLEAAVERTGEIERQLTETAEALDKSNQVLRELVTPERR